MGGYPPLRNTTGSVPPVSVRTTIFQVTQSEASQLCRSSRHDCVPVLPPCAIGFSNSLFFRYSEPRLLIRAETASPEIAPESMLRLRPIDCNFRFLKLARMTVRDPGREPRGHRAREMKKPGFRRAYETIGEEFAALDALLDARRAAGLTQAQVAARMGVKQSALARIEASLSSRRHSPSLETLRKYAQAVGRRLEIRLV